MRALIGRHIASLATFTNPMATSCEVIEEPLPVSTSCSERKWFTCSVSLWKASIVAGWLRGSSSLGPKILGKYLQRVLHTVRADGGLVFSATRMSHVTQLTNHVTHCGRSLPRQRLASVTVRGPPDVCVCRGWGRGGGHTSIAHSKLHVLTSRPSLMWLPWLPFP